MKKYKKLAEISAENLENRRFRLYHPFNNKQSSDKVTS